MATGPLRATTIFIVILNLSVYITILALAGWAVDTSIDGNPTQVSDTDSTTYLMMFALIASAAGVGAMVSGLHHAHSWTLESYAATAAVSLVALMLGLEALGFASKGINSGAFRCKQVKAVEALVIVAAIIQLLYVVILRIGKFIGEYA